MYNQIVHKEILVILSGYKVLRIGDSLSSFPVLECGKGKRRGHGVIDWFLGALNWKFDVWMLHIYHQDQYKVSLLPI